MILSLIWGLTGVLFLVLGRLIRKKEKIELLQEYHRNKVSETDKKRFCDLCGTGVGIIGAGLVLSAVWFGFTQELWSLSPFAVGFLVGLGMLVRAIWKYNR